MTKAKRCLDCHSVRSIEAFFQTQRGAGRSDRCRDCIGKRAEAHRAEKGRTQETAKRPLRARSNRPQMRQCWGCGETVPRVDLWEYRLGPGRAARSNYCGPCMQRRAVERECADCTATKLTSEFSTELATSPYCSECREKRTREKHCPRCGFTKAIEDFNRSYGKPAGWCKECAVEAQRERRARARAESA